MASNPDSLQTQAAPTTQPQDAPDVSTVSDEENVSGEGVNLQRAYSKLNSAISAMLDGLGIRRASTIPHVAGQSMSDHIGAVGDAVAQVGGISNNLLVATHTKHSSTGGETIAYPSGKLRETIIPQKSEEAKAAINACKNFVAKVESLVGETPEVKTAKSQLALIGKNDMAGMTSFDASAALLSVPSPLIQLVAQKHDSTKDGGLHPMLRGPKV
jgi:hypothetical protein